MNPIIDVRNISYTYPGGVKALSEVSLSINNNEIVAILGSNGSGKTTLVKHFNGLLKPSRGSVIVDGIDIKNQSVAKTSQKVGYVFQNPNHQLFLPTVREELYYGLKNLDITGSEADDKVKASIDLFNIHNFLDRSPFDLNSSERKIVAMASVMAVEPKVIVLDEPTTGQDYAGIMQVGKLIRNMHAKGHAIVIITHDMNIVGELNCRTVLMKNSRKIADDRADRVFTNVEIMNEASIEPPQITTFVERLLGIKDDACLTIENAIEKIGEEYITPVNRKQAMEVSANGY